MKMHKLQLMSKNCGVFASHKYEATRTHIAKKINDSILEDYIKNISITRTIIIPGCMEITFN